MTMDIDTIRRDAGATDTRSVVSAYHLADLVPALCDEVERLREQVFAQKPVIEAAEAWAEMCDDGGIAPDDCRTAEDALYDAVEQYRLMDTALTSAREEAEVAR